MYREFLFPLLRLLNPEATHELTLRALELAQRQPLALRALRRQLAVEDRRLEVPAFGLRFPNPVGLAAGYDKNGIVVPGLAALGFGHVEVGTVTPQPQPGKPSPRLFRLPQDRALINRLGFPSQGVDFVKNRVSCLRKPNFVLGVNIGPNAQSMERGKEIADFLVCFDELHAYADYLTVNVSSPNTPGLRRLQGKQALADLLAALSQARAAARSEIPVLVKIAPDLSEGELSDILEVATAHPIAGVVATNTTVQRPATLRSAALRESGGLSGAPLAQRSTEVIRAVRRLTDGRLPIVGVGGVFSSADVIEKLRAGASLVQLYTGMIYEGPAIVRDINRGLLAYLNEHGMTSVEELIGSE